jgi:predicted DsbA family dithiol-disulfide isomerase
VSGVPFFLIEERFAVAGAQPATVLVSALRRALAEAHRIDIADASGDGADPAACAGGSCGV